MQLNTLRLLLAATVLSILTISILLFSKDSSAGKYILKSSSKSHQCPSAPANEPWDFIPARDADNHGLSNEQCRLAFPKLFIEIDRSASERANKSISFKEIEGVETGDGLGRAAIYNGELYIIELGDMPYTGTRAKSTLYSLHRALTSSPDRPSSIPNIEFVFSTDDFVSDPTVPIWTYSKRPDESTTWLMPDFGFWAWPEVRIGPYSSVRRKIADVDESLPFQEKKKQLVWRGSLTPNPPVRSKLVKTAVDKSWGSVRVLDWDDENDLRYNLLPIEDHCRYMFLAHTEGRSFSGRGKYLLNCRSVMVSHRLEWKEAHHGALIATGPDANFVEVESDFSDLERKIEYLIDRPEAAERIADNAVTTFRDRYLTPAAESCYWRELVRLYGEVSEFEPVLTDKDGRSRAVPFDTWVLGY